MERHGMKQTALAALLACTGMAWTAIVPAHAVVPAPSRAAVATPDSMITQVQRGEHRRGGGDSGGRASSGRSHDAGRSRAEPSRSSRPSRDTGRASRSEGSRAYRGEGARSGRPTFRGPPSSDRSSRARNGRPDRAFDRRPSGRGPGFRGPGARPDRAFVHRRGHRPSNFRRWHPRHHAYRKWHRRPHYGYVLGGVTLGAILAASAYYAYADEPPADGLCWFWADDDETRGYWDYCEDPDDD